METVCGFGGQEEEMELPPGFRFHPTDEELISHYLAPKVLDSNFCARAIGEVDLNKVEPWDLPWRAKMGEKEWYFFCMRDKKYPTGQRTNRATEAGYWKATGKDKEIFKLKTLVGMKKTLVFYKGRAPRGEKSNWVMHEYRLDGKYSVHNLPKTAKNECVICRIFKKNSGGKKIPISNLMRSDSLTDNSRSSNLPPLMDMSPYNNNTQITTTARSSGETSNSHVTCFSDSAEDQKPQTHHHHPLSSSPVSVDFPSNFVPNQSMAYMENFQYGDSGLMQDNSIMRLLLDNNYGSESKQSLRGFEDHDFRGIPKYIVAGPSEMLAITGSGIPEILLKKKHFLWPLQKCTRLDISPVNYSFEVQAMSAEKLPFFLPAVFTIGPKVLDESLIKYAKLVSNTHKESTHIKDLVKGVIEGETRVLAASMTMEQIFKGTKEFKREVFDKVQLELNQFGLYIYNANVKQLVDVPGHEYFSYLGQKTQMEAANQAKIDVAEARMKGEIGSKVREAETKQNAAKIDAETFIISTRRQGEGKKEEVKVKTEVKIFENQREADVLQATAELAKKKAGWSQTTKLAEVEAEKAVAIREAELQMEVEKKKAFAETAKLKAELLSKANVEYEIKVQEANAELYKRQKEAEAALFESQKKAEAFKANADAELHARQQTANSELYAKQKEAEGVTAMGKAQATYLGSILKELNHNYSALRDYMMINNGIYQEIAQINSQAVSGMQPKISIWSGSNTGENNGGEGGSALKDVASVYRMLPPLLETVHEQTGMQPPAWLGTLPDKRK